MSNDRGTLTSSAFLTFCILRLGILAFNSVKSGATQDFIQLGLSTTVLLPTIALASYWLNLSHSSSSWAGIPKEHSSMIDQDNNLFEFDNLT